MSLGLRVPILLLAALAAREDECSSKNLDQKQSVEQSQSLEEAHARIGMPALDKFQERRLVKDLYELRDKSVATHTYLVNELSGCLVYLGPSVGYGIPYATQFTAPTRVACDAPGPGCPQIPQAEPNGLFMPDNAEGTWVMLKDPEGDDVKPTYIEPRVIVAPFRMKARECPEKTAEEAPKHK